jgi:hypothetical protein
MTAIDPGEGMASRMVALPAPGPENGDLPLVLHTHPRDLFSEIIRGSAKKLAPEI